MVFQEGKKQKNLENFFVTKKKDNFEWNTEFTSCLHTQVFS